MFELCGILAYIASFILAMQGYVLGILFFVLMTIAGFLWIVGEACKDSDTLEEGVASKRL